MKKLREEAQASIKVVPFDKDAAREKVCKEFPKLAQAVKAVGRKRTQEQRKRETLQRNLVMRERLRSGIPLKTVCRAFGITHQRFYQILRELDEYDKRSS